LKNFSPTTERKFQVPKKKTTPNCHWNVAVYMNYEKFKRSDRPDRSHSLTTVNCLRFSLRCWGKVFQWLQEKLTVVYITENDSTVSYFNKMRYLFGVNNQLKDGPFNLVNCQRFSLRCRGQVFQWLPKDWHKKVSYFCKMKFVHVHFAADWMNKFPNRGRYQIANIISWQNSLYCSLCSQWIHS
jgi:hypothetical protein